MKKNGSQKSTSEHDVAKWPPSATTPWTLTLGQCHFETTSYYTSPLQAHEQTLVRPY